jgi:hypothetical protein
MLDHLHSVRTAPKLGSNEQKKLKCDDILNLLHWKTTNVSIKKNATQKNHVKIKIGKIERVVGPLAHDEIHSKI